MADTEKRVKVTFSQTLPIGTRGTFSHDGELWIAFPSKKYVRIVTLIDRFVGIFAGVQRDTLRIINDHPEDARRVSEILSRVSKYRELHRELVTEKVRSQTS